jgi:hypothetical protein
MSRNSLSEAALSKAGERVVNEAVAGLAANLAMANGRGERVEGNEGPPGGRHPFPELLLDGHDETAAPL